jgi:hypothetical protein
MMKLDFDFDTSTGGCHCSLPEQTAAYRGYTIRAAYDQVALNPFEEFARQAYAFEIRA